VAPIAVRNARRVRFAMDQDEMVREVPTYPAPPKPAQPVATEPPIEVNAKPLIPMQTWANLVLDSAEASATQRKPPARAGLPAEKKTIAASKRWLTCGADTPVRRL
jgi:hypothetical protein